jgi:hypothetical protein
LTSLFYEKANRGPFDYEYQGRKFKITVILKGNGNIRISVDEEENLTLEQALDAIYILVSVPPGDASVENMLDSPPTGYENF